MAAASSFAVLGLASASSLKTSSPSPNASRSAVSNDPSVARGTAFGAAPATRLHASGSKLEAKKRMFDDPFDYGEDTDLTYGDLLSTGKQDVQDPRPKSDPDSDKGWLSFPEGYLPEIASLGLYIRDDVRKCVLLVAGGVYENLLFFPVIQLLKDKYPGVRVDVVANPRGKQAYELNKYVRRAWVYDLDSVHTPPADFTEFLGKIKNECYDLVLSTKQAGIGHGLLLFLTDARQRVSYVAPNVNGAGAGTFLSEALYSDREILAEAGYKIYKELEDFLSKPTRDVPGLNIPPLEIAIPKKVREVARSDYEAAGVKPGKFLLVHGIESTSQASMRSLGDTDSSLSLAALGEIVKASSLDVLVVIPNENDASKVYQALGENAHVVKYTTPGKLAAAISDSAAVVTTNTAAVQIALSLKKQTIALFGSEEKAKKFIPETQANNVSVVFSDSGKLSDIDLSSVSSAVRALESSLLVSA